MTSVSSSTMSQAQILIMMQQLAAQNSQAAAQANQNGSSQDSSNVSGSSGSGSSLIGGNSANLTSDLMALLVQAQGVTASGTDSSNASSDASTGQQSGFGQDFQQLVQAIQSGNLSSAQQAFATVSQDLSANSTDSSQTANSQTAANNPFVTALNQIGSDLQSGNMTGAQQTLSSLQQQPEAHHHHHGGGGDGGLSSLLDGSSSSSTGQPTTVTEVNADGSTTTVTTNPDGSVTTTTTGEQAASGSGANSDDGLQDLLTALQQLGIG